MLPQTQQARSSGRFLAHPESGISLLSLCVVMLFCCRCGVIFDEPLVLLDRFR